MGRKYRWYRSNKRRITLGDHPILAASTQFHNHTRTPSEYWRHSRVRVEAGRFAPLAERLPVPRRNLLGASPSIEFALRPRPKPERLPSTR